MKKLLIVVVALAVLAAGAIAVVTYTNPGFLDSTQADMADKTNSTAKAKNAAPKDDKTAIRERVQARWDALIALDMDTVYSFTTPAYRATYDKTHLIGQYGAQLKRNGITIRDIKIDGDEASVKVTLSFTTFANGNPLTLDSFEDETWVKSKGQWWYVERN